MDQIVTAWNRLGYGGKVYVVFVAVEWVTAATIVVRYFAA